jgi:hypothetical protein
MFGSLGAFNVGVLGVNSTAVLLSFFRPSFILVVPERCFSIGDSPARCSLLLHRRFFSFILGRAV